MFNIAICDDDTFFIDYIEKVIVEVNGSDKDINFICISHAEEIFFFILKARYFCGMWKLEWISTC